MRPLTNMFDGQNEGRHEKPGEGAAVKEEEDEVKETAGGEGEDHSSTDIRANAQCHSARSSVLQRRYEPEFLEWGGENNLFCDYRFARIRRCGWPTSLHYVAKLVAMAKNCLSPL